jgi:heme/copper-type cytochrome/quinol oxidase subunit 2
MKRGDFGSYLVLLVIFSLSIILLLGMYFALDPVWMKQWGSRYHWYLLEYRPLAAKLWRMLYRLTSSLVFIVLPIMWMLAIYLVQSGMKRENAKRFNLVHIALNLILFLMVGISLFSLTYAPLSYNR